MLVMMVMVSFNAMHMMRMPAGIPNYYLALSGSRGSCGRPRGASDYGISVGLGLMVDEPP